MIFSMLDLNSWSSLLCANKFFRNLGRQPLVIRSLLEKNQIPITKRIEFAKMAGSKLDKLDLNFSNDEYLVINSSQEYEDLFKVCPNIKHFTILI